MTDALAPIAVFPLGADCALRVYHVPTARMKRYAVRLFDGDRPAPLSATHRFPTLDAARQWCADEAGRAYVR